MFAPLILLTTAGMLGVLAMCPLSKVAWGFVRLLAILALALTSGVLAWHGLVAGHPAPIWALWGAGGAMAAACVAVLTLAPLMERRPAAVGYIRWLAAIGALCGLAAGLGLALTAGDSAVDGAAAGGMILLAAVGYLLSALLTASVNVGWLLGHRYLTATGMTIDPLRRISEVLIVAIGARWIFMLLAVAIIAALPGGEGPSAWTRLAQDWLMLSIRVGVGLVLPSVMIYMAWECVRLRSTQSATGILFFTSVFIIIGELTSQYLSRPLGVPI